MGAWTQADFDRHAAGFQATWDDFALALSQDFPADSDHVREIARRLHGLLGDAAPTPLSKARFLAVSDIYAEHPHLRSSLDARVPGLTDYVVSAMRAVSEGMA